MKFVGRRPSADANAAARKLVEIATGVRAFFAEPDAIKRDEIAAGQLRALRACNPPRAKKLRLADVPDEAVVTGPNRDGRTLVWYYDVWTSHSGIPGKVIKCFMPGTMT